LIENDPMLLEYLSDELKGSNDNLEIVKLAVAKDGYSLRHAHNYAKNSTQVIQLATKGGNRQAIDLAGVGDRPKKD
jgi:hypothetical protein